MKIIAVSGYFDPLHAGHIEYFKLAKALGDKLVVILNNDEQICLRKSKPFMPLEQRRKILEAIKYVDEVYVSIDRDDETVCRSLQVVMPHVFAKGGDKFKYEIPEASICEELGIEVVDSLGKKIQSSSDLVERWMDKQRR
jgi:cytidyltransferase-like protein